MDFKRILVALDRSFQSPYIFEQALKQAEGDCQIRVFHALRLEPERQISSFLSRAGRTHETGATDFNFQDSLREFQQKRVQQEIQKAQNWFQPCYQRAAEKGIPVELDCRFMEPEVGICDLAQTWNADLIVLGRRGYQGLKEATLGSVSHYVISHAPCSILLIQGIGAGVVNPPMTTIQ